MQEILDDTHDQEDHGERQTGDGQHTQEGQTGFGSIEHGDQIGNSIGDPVTNSGEDSQNSIKNGSSLKNTLLYNFTAFYFNGCAPVAYMVAADGFEPP